MTDLWPADILTVPNIKLPVEILREQANLLGGKTKNLVEAFVVSIVKDKSYDSYADAHDVYDSYADIDDDLEPIEFTYCFVLSAPTLGNYTYSLFYITYGPEVFPVTIKLDEELRHQIDHNLIVNSEEEFLEILAKILNAPKTKRIIQALFTHSLAISKTYFRK